MRLCVFLSSRRRHTRYWRDWSSDVCSTDLHRVARAGHPEVGGEEGASEARELPDDVPGVWSEGGEGFPDGGGVGGQALEHRLVDRKSVVGKECRSRWSPDHSKKIREIESRS